MNVSLGTAQFGFDYGVSNANGKVPLDDVSRIIDKARKGPVCTLDTAIVYGDSEKILGEVGVNGFDIITKLPEIPNDIDVKEWAFNAIENSLSLLNVESLHGILLHKPSQLEGNQGERIWRVLEELKNQGYTKKVGVSVYGPEYLEKNFHRYDFDIVQTSANVIDRRIVSSGWLNALEKNDVEVHLRSAFLQGVLLQNHSERADWFSRWDELFAKWDYWQKSNFESKVEACLAHIAAIARHNSVLIGVSSYSEFNEVMKTIETLSPLEAPQDLVSQEQDLINPALWRI
jgi:aryl-alcohol dehydrogenase-like predicted oxidoreductase